MHTMFYVFVLFCCNVLVGMLYDITGDYSATFYAGGACLIACGALHFLLHLKYFKGKTD